MRTYYGKLGRHMRKKCKEAGLTYSATGEALGITYQQVQKYFSGENRIPIHRVYQIADLLECDVTELLIKPGE